MIAFFDSGYGGLSVFLAVQKLLPQYDYLYLGDNARAPYGERSSETITQFTREAVDFLLARGATLIITACNTVSSTALRQIQEEYIRQPKITDKNILGVIRPVAEAVAEITKNKRVGIVGTRATINSQAFIQEIAKLNPNITVFSKACPLLVPLIEEGLVNRPETTMILKKYLREMKTYNIDTLALACTHYPFLMDKFTRFFGKKVQVLHPGMIVGQKLIDYLSRHPEIAKTLSQKGTATFFTTEYPGKFHEVVTTLLGYQLQNVSHVQLSSS